MRDLYVEQAIERLVEETGGLFRELIAGGAELQYEVAAQPGERTPLYRYAPLTHRFIRKHAPEVSDLPSFAAARSAIVATNLASGYLEQAGASVPADPKQRADQMLCVFLCRFWEDCADFTVEGERLDAALAEVWACAEVGGDAVEVIVPIVGLQMPLSRLELAEATLVRADGVDVPPEAKHSEGMGRAAWEPQFLAVAAISSDDETPVGAKLGFRRLITTLRMFKFGGVGLGPHAWARTGERWRRISTGAGRPRSGGYEIAEEEAAELIAFSGALAARGARGRPLAWAISRFEMGTERPSLLEGLSDYILALRALLEGGGPADVGLSMRIAALCAEPDERIQLKAAVDRALDLERSLMAGVYPDEIADSPLKLAATIEQQLRAILRDAACGHLGADLRATADEILLADGLSAGEGEGQRGGTSEWLAANPDTPDDPDTGEWIAQPDPVVEDAASELHASVLRTDDYGPEPADETAEEMTTSEPEPGGNMRHTARFPGNAKDDEMRVYKDPGESPDWLDQVSELRDSTLEWPPISEPTRRQKARPEVEHEDHPSTDAPERVRHLFPVPDATEWSVGELEYSRDRYDIRS